MAEIKNLPLPDEFLDFLKENGLDPSIYAMADSTPRYIRYSNSKLKGLCRRKGLLFQIYGIDAASGAAVSALNISFGDHVLDLCAAPGAKICMILDILGNSGSVTGVDVARHRLAACRTMLQKYALGDRCRLFVADGTTFSIIPSRGLDYDFNLSSSPLEERVDAFKEWTSRRPWKERKLAAKAAVKGQSVKGLRNPELIFYGPHSGVIGLTKDEVYESASSEKMTTEGYDKVLVDAECTHDGSIKHIQKFENWGWKTLPHRVLNAERTDCLTLLQVTDPSRAGSISFHGLTVAQNEDVVEQFLSNHVSAGKLRQHAKSKLQEIDGSENCPCRSGQIPKTLRFDPLTSQTSGLFIAKFKKLPS
ncbi:SAM-dependent methyltransferase RsmB/NOP2-type [Dillenia turbinata]|uniref:SAM-dependent methyltransferase RsmB/NOP2-type n=1 Tax=Dillenia turbinata TaxID=194707 RepID=A0AAN8Z4I8_9MAGN